MVKIIHNFCHEQDLVEGLNLYFRPGFDPKAMSIDFTQSLKQIYRL